MDKRTRIKILEHQIKELLPLHRQRENDRQRIEASMHRDDIESRRRGSDHCHNPYAYSSKQDRKLRRRQLRVMKTPGVIG